MAAQHTMTIKTGDLMKSVTINVRLAGLQQYRFRLWLAGRLVALAAFIAGCGLKVEQEPQVRIDVQTDDAQSFRQSQTLIADDALQAFRRKGQQ